MIIHNPDLYPGRCPNLRINIGPYGQSEWLRCLDYADIPHVCSFPAPRIWATDPSYSMSTYRPPKPVPWVRPGDAPRSSTSDEAGS